MSDLRQTLLKPALHTPVPDEDPTDSRAAPGGGVHTAAPPLAAQALQGYGAWHGPPRLCRAQRQQALQRLLWEKPPG